MFSSHERFILNHTQWSSQVHLMLHYVIHFYSSCFHLFTLSPSIYPSHLTVSNWILSNIKQGVNNVIIIEKIASRWSLQLIRGKSCNTMDKTTFFFFSLWSSYYSQLVTLLPESFSLVLFLSECSLQVIIRLDLMKQTLVTTGSEQKLLLLW